eukprot:g32965.t1
MMPALTAPDPPVPSVTAADVRLVFLGVNPRKATGPDSIPSRALRSRVDQLAEVFTDIFNITLLKAEVPACFKNTNIIPKERRSTCPIYINGSQVERVESVKFFGDHKKLQKVVCTAQTITEANLPSMDSIHTAFCQWKGCQYHQRLIAP